VVIIEADTPFVIKSCTQSGRKVMLAFFIRAGFNVLETFVTWGNIVEISLVVILFIFAWIFLVIYSMMARSSKLGTLRLLREIEVMAKELVHLYSVSLADVQ